MKRGFALAELIIAIGVFLTVVAIAVGGFAQALKTTRDAANLLAVNANVSLAIEQMTREMRTGYDFCVAGQICSGGSDIAFRNADQDAIRYYLEDGALFRECTGQCEGASGREQITASNVGVKTLAFDLFGEDPGDGYQPRITIRLGVGFTGANNPGIVVRLQSTISPRIPLDS
jgi:type II secretory pathway pseudopilin PulG